MCKECEAGFQCNRLSIPDLKEESLWCKPGTYRKKGSDINCNECRMGTYNENYKSPSIDDCIKCKGGYVCRKPGIGEWSIGLDNKDITDCKKGYWCPEGTDKTNQLSNKCS